MVLPWTPTSLLMHIPHTSHTHMPHTPSRAVLHLGGVFVKFKLILCQLGTPKNH